MHCQSNKLQSFTVWQDFGKIAQRSYSYSTCLLYEWVSRKAFLITVAEEENMSQTSLCWNPTRAATPSYTMHEQSEHLCNFSCFEWHIKPRTFTQHISVTEGRGHIAVVTQVKLFMHSFFFIAHSIIDDTTVWTVWKACVQTLAGTLVVMTCGMQDTYI